MRLNAQQIDWISSEFQAGREVDEISIDTGLSVPSIKRALSEAGDLDLAWHKSKEQHKILQYLRSRGITKLSQFNGV